MKTLLLKILVVTNFLLIYSCKSQTTNDYITFYNNLVPKLNSLVPNKIQYYNQNFSNFNTELQNNGINIISFTYYPKVIPGIQYYVLNLNFIELDMWKIASENSYRRPFISITFQDEIPSQIDQLSIQSQGRWNPTIAQFFANMKIEKIEFVGINGYNNPDRTIK
ncbi:hypothetical protein [Chryseobacterium cheonjiense]|uniref:Lipoprotein n=1 Tax=Chryseobacterium cheonjiense TaxID=2728845 RepID=A0A7Y0A4P8_9FLAO|nr:hypothetical protein [Chryseobacterium cheonjiense]NML56541.1 hypothetical protein [Chryseobacterium cheonjiense]